MTARLTTADGKDNLYYSDRVEAQSPKNVAKVYQILFSTMHVRDCMGTRLKGQSVSNGKKHTHLIQYCGNTCTGLIWACETFVIGVKYKVVDGRNIL